MFFVLPKTYVYAKGHGIMGQPITKIINVLNSIVSDGVYGRGSAEVG